MLIAYVGESYNHDFYFVGAAIAHYDSWDALAQRYDAVRAATAEKHGVSPTAEFRGHELMGGTGDWTPLRGKHREAVGVYVAHFAPHKSAG